MMSTDLVLLNPPTSLSKRYGALGAGGSTLPPLGLAMLAAVARAAGFTVAIIDAECLGLTAEEAAQAALTLAPRVLGVSAVTMTVHDSALVARLVKSAAPSTFAIIGGAHVSALPEATLEAFPWLDAAALGEAEQTLVEVLTALIRREGSLRTLGSLHGPLSLRDIPGLLLRDSGGELIRTASREPLVDLDALPFPAWDLLPSLADAYRPPLNGVSRLPGSSLITSRGCAGRCTFCDRAVSGHRMRFHSAVYVLGMVETLHAEYGIRDIHFHDDNFLANPARLLELCELLEARRMDLRWSAEGRVDLVRPDLLAAMKRAGCWQIAFGLESGSQEMLDRLSKGTTIEQACEAIRMTHAAGIQSRGLFMVGTPGETPDTIRATRRFMLSLRLDDMVVQTFSPHPGTEIARTLGMAENSPSEWINASRFEVSYVPEGLEAADLMKAQRRMFRDFYLRPRIILDYARRMLSDISLARKLPRGLFAWISFVFSSSAPSSERNPDRRGTAE